MTNEQYQMRIVCVHQGFELYGSDRSFAESVSSIRTSYPAAEITVVLPKAGSILELLNDASQIVYDNLWVLRRKQLPRLIATAFYRLPMAIIQAAARMRKYDLTYINTSVILDHIVAARLFPGTTLVHVHEIPEGMALRIFRAFLIFSRAEIIFNSNATAAAFQLPPSIKSTVIYNGIAGPSAPVPQRYDGSRPLRLLMLGRINRIKGQEILVQAIAALPESVRDRVAVRIVGSAFEDDEREQSLRRLVDSLQLTDIVSLEPFSRDTASLYEWSDIVVVPSQMPESLGRVAIEAMSFARPALVSAIGGLTEIVENNTTGWHVKPGAIDDLAATLQAIVENPMAWQDYGAYALARYEAVFSEESVSNALSALIASKLKTRVQKSGSNEPRFGIGTD